MFMLSMGQFQLVTGVKSRLHAGEAALKISIKKKVNYNL